MEAYSPTMQFALGATMIGYVGLMFAIAWVAQRRVKNQTDYLVAGRRLNLSLAWMTLMATWFGAGTMLVVADDVRTEGLRAAALDPLGAGFCLLLAGWLIAGKMWRAQILTVPDLFAQRFGKRSEFVCSCIMIPSYFGWIATQLVALGTMLELIFGMPLAIAILIIAVVTTAYTLMGGMWSVTLTDAVQVILLLAGLVILTISVVWQLGDGNPSIGAHRLFADAPEGHWDLIPTETSAVFLAWTGLLVVGALGNLPGQDLMQRIFAAKSAKVARNACLIAGGVYLTFGAIPIVLAAGAGSLFPDDIEKGVLPALAHAFLSPVMCAVFVVVLLSAVMSTIDSAILAPAGILSKNLLGPRLSVDPLTLNRWCVIAVACCSLIAAYSGKTAYELLEEAYAITLVGLFVPMMFALYTKPKRELPAVASMIVGIGIWSFHFVAGWESFLSGIDAIGNWELPVSLVATFTGLITYLFFDSNWLRRR